MFDSTLKIILKNLKEYPVMKKISAYAKQSESGEFEGYLDLKKLLLCYTFIFSNPYIFSNL